MFFGDRGGIPDEYQQWIMENFVSQHLENLEFSCLHEAILELRITKIQDEVIRLRSTGTTIDIQDSWGYTPLHWASVRGDNKAVIQLLEFGANPNTTNKYGQTPLNMALWSGDLQSALHLLSHGANACYVTNQGWAAFQVAVGYCGSHPSIVNLLDKLLELDADINVKNAGGYSSLFIAAQLNHHRALRWLLSHGADYTASATNGTTILHILGYSADLETIEILRQARLRGIDVNAGMHDDDGKAIDELSGRVPAPSDKLVANFVRLLSEIKGRTKGEIPDYDRIGNDIPSNPETMPSDSDIVVGSNQTTEETLNPSAEDSVGEEQAFVSVDSLEDQPMDPVVPPRRTRGRRIRARGTRTRGIRRRRTFSVSTD